MRRTVFFLGNYLTTEGREKNQDIKMLEDLGFEIELMPKQEEVLFFLMALFPITRWITEND